MCKRKLLLITNGFPFGNSERGFLSTEYQHLQESFEVYILARIPQPPCEQWGKIDTDRVRCTEISSLRPMHVLAQVRRSRVRNELAQACRNSGTKQMIKRASAVLRYSARADIFQDAIENLCVEKQIDLIYTYWCTQATLAAVRVKEKYPQIKVVTRFHGYDLYNERTEELWQPYRREIAQKCDKLIFACQLGQEYFKDHWQTNGEDFVSFLGCTHMQLVRRKQDQPFCLVSCSNLVSLKRVEYIIDALAHLPNSVQVQWHHFGDGPERQSLEEIAGKKLGGLRNIQWKFHGAILNEQINDAYDQLGVELFITTSSTEGVPVTIQEAFAMGIPAIGTAVGGIPELVVDGHTGYLLSEDPEISQVSEAILKFAALSSEEKEKMSENAWKMWHEKCDAEKNACRLTQMLKYLLSEREDHKDERFDCKD